VVRNNTINSQLTTSSSEPNNHFTTTTNGNNINNNNSLRSDKSSGDTSLEEDISPWLVKDNVMTNNKRSDKSRIPLLKTVITTEL
jgi:hypothetical protein